MSDFRIIVHMHNFFTDHRSSCRLFITSKIKIIEDLKQHISNLFELPADFYLISNNLYLPSLEDVRVLREDDIVVVVPCNKKFSTDTICCSKSEETLEFQNSSNNKISKRKSSTFDDSKAEIFDLQNLMSVKKKKKIKHSVNENTDCTSTEANNLESISTDKEKKSKRNTDSFNKDTQKLISNPNALNEKQRNTIKQDTKIDEFKNESGNDSFNAFNNAEEPPYKFEKKKKIREKSNVDENLSGNIELPFGAENNSKKSCITLRKNVKLMEISTKPKIVKSIRVCDRPLAISHSNNVECVSTPNISLGRNYNAENEVLNLETTNGKHVPVSTTNGLKYSFDESKKNEIESPRRMLSNNFVETKAEEASQTFGMDLTMQNNDESQQCASKSNGIVQSSMQPLLENESKQNAKQITMQKLVTLFRQPLNKNESVNKMEKINIISVKTVDGEQNQTSNEQLIKNKTIGPQLIPFSENMIMASVSNASECKEEHATPKIVVHSFSQDNTENNPQDINKECSEDLKDPCFTTPSESLVSSLTEESGVDLSMSFESKKKRKRVRKRKPKAKKEEQVFETPIVNPKPVFTSAAPALHIRFDNEDANQKDSTSLEDTPDVIDINLNFEKLCNKEIIKYPVMKDIFPKQGDVIAFKICKLSNSYTPEVSEAIIAKVLNFCSTSDKVSVTILEGADQCCTPEGKFYMESYDNEDEQEERNFSWSELIEPRLLFP